VSFQVSSHAGNDRGNTLGISGMYRLPSPSSPRNGDDHVAVAADRFQAVDPVVGEVTRYPPLPSGEAQPFDPAGGVAWIAARSSFDILLTAAVWREAERCLEDRACRTDARRRLGERPTTSQSRIANTTIVVIEFH
jgi:hypothetical protein